MSFSTPSFDAAGAASAQGRAERAATSAGIIMNNMDERTPYGNIDVQRNGFEIIRNENGQRMRVPTFQRTVSLSPVEKEKQRLQNQIATRYLNAGVQQVGQAAGALKDPFTLDGMPARTDSVRAPTLPNAFDASEIGTTYNSGGPLGNFRSPVGQTERMGAGPQYQTSYAPEDGFSADRQRYEDAIMSRVSDDMQQDRTSLERQLMAQGLQRGTGAFNDSMDEMRRAETDARMQAILAGGREQSRMLGEARAAGQFTNDALGRGFSDEAARTQINQGAQAQDFAQGLAGYDTNRTSQQQRDQQSLQAATFGAGATAQNNAARQAEHQAQMARAQQGFQNQLTAGQFGNDARATAIQEQVLERTQPLNEIAAIQSGSQVNVPTFQNQYRQGVNAAPVADLMWRQHQSEAANSQAAMSGMFGLGSTLLGLPAMFSDERVKTDIKRVGKTNKGLPIYSYRYKAGGPFQLGVMAQELEKKRPDAVHEIGGVKAVQYEKVA